MLIRIVWTILNTKQKYNLFINFIFKSLFFRTHMHANTRTTHFFIADETKDFMWYLSPLLSNKRVYCMRVRVCTHFICFPLKIIPSQRTEDRTLLQTNQFSLVKPINHNAAGRQLRTYIICWLSRHHSRWPPAVMSSKASKPERRGEMHSSQLCLVTEALLNLARVCVDQFPSLTQLSLIDKRR